MNYIVMPTPPGHCIDTLNLPECGAPQTPAQGGPTRSWTHEAQPGSCPPATVEDVLRIASTSKADAIFQQDKATGNQLVNGEWEGVYPSASEARLPLMSLLLFVTGGNCEGALEAFKLSGQMTEKLEGRDTLLRAEILKVWQTYQGDFYGTEAAADETDPVVVELAALSDFEYEKIRKEKASAMGVRVRALDSFVANERNKAEVEEAGAAFLQDPEPHHAPVSLVALLDDISTILNRHLILPKHADVLITLWVLVTYLTDVISTLPILTLRSPEPRCGKTTAIELLSKIVRCALPTSNMTPATMFRAVDLWVPLTLMIDEADAFLREQEELRGIINSGHTRAAAYVLRSVGDDHTPTRFSTWCAKVIALIGQLSGTLMDRSLVVLLRRKHRGEKVIRLRDIDPSVFVGIQSRCRRWADDNRALIHRARPVIPAELHDRAADNWDPLLAVADAAGPEWSVLARSAALASSRAGDDSESRGVMLLEDLQTIFQQDNRSRVPTRDILEKLHLLEERPWPDFSRGKPISAPQLAQLLRPFSVRPSVFREHQQIVRGYRLQDLQDAFSRYLATGTNSTPAPESPNQSVTTQQSSTGAPSSGFQHVTPATDVTGENGLEPAPLSQSYGVTGKNPESGAAYKKFVRDALLGASEQ